MRINPDDQETDYALFGMVLLQWGHIEAELVNILLRLTHPLFGFLVEKGLPRGFSDQTRLAKRLYRKIPHMADLRDEACSLLGTLGPLHKTRSIIVHGYYQGYTGHDQFRFGIFEKRVGPRMVNKTLYFTQAQVTQLSSDIDERRVRMATLSKNTFRVRLPKAERAR